LTGHTMPQPPQLALSMFGSTQVQLVVPPQSTRPSWQLHDHVANPSGDGAYPVAQPIALTATSLNAPSPLALGASHRRY
jgi:hypothetical protein